MDYFDIINQAIQLCITTDSESNISYLEPPYRMLLREAGLINEEVISNEELYELLKLEVEKRNAKVNRLQPILNWIYDTVSSTVEPAITQEENEMMKNLVEYMRLNKEHKANDQESEDSEQVSEDNSTPVDQTENN